MQMKSLCAAVLIAASFGAATSAHASGTYITGSIVSQNPVLWFYYPATNKIKLCYATMGNSLACTALVNGFSSAPNPKNNLQYRVVPAVGALWIIDTTANTAVLCQASFSNSAYQITVTRGGGIN
jgi:hypothetical protein